MKYAIHTIKKRMWYVNDFLIPSMKKQGIRDKDISLWVDDQGWGNLHSFMKSMVFAGNMFGTSDGCWHMHDDIVISRNFAKETAEHDTGIVCGFCCREWDGRNTSMLGDVARQNMWMSPQCMRIPNDLAAECGDWFYNYAVPNRRFKRFIQANMYEDTLFRLFLEDRHIDIRGYNLFPNIVNHVDYLIGGTTTTFERDGLRVAHYWEDDDLIEELAHEIHDTHLSNT